ncbi:MAG: hypothetical protein E6Q78_15130 [Rhodoferax sp.]|nr:MAG: hypothetical protein E6Q78_15130 [Rhodoferax sp.]
MPPLPSAIPENTAVRTFLWRALHLEIDAPPRMFEYKIGCPKSPDWGMSMLLAQSQNTATNPAREILCFQPSPFND